MSDDNPIGYANHVYSRQLISVCTDPIYKSFMEMYNRISTQAINKNEILSSFQLSIKQIPNWTKSQIFEQVQKTSVNCNFLPDLLAAVYLSNVKILSAVKIKKSSKKVHVKIPDLNQFIHTIFINVAQRIYDNPKCFSIREFGIEMNNKEIIHSYIQNAIQDALIKMLPFQNILQTYFGNKLHGGHSSSSDSDSECTENLFDLLSASSSLI